MRVHGLDGEAAADPAEIVAVEKVGLSVLAEREDQGLVAVLSGDVQRKRISSAEVGVERVESLPIRRAKKSFLSSDRCRSGASRKTASPSLQVAAPSVLPVATNNDSPSVLIPPGAQMPPPRPRVAQLLTVRGSEREIPTTKP